MTYHIVASNLASLSSVPTLTIGLAFMLIPNTKERHVKNSSWRVHLMIYHTVASNLVIYFL